MNIKGINRSGKEVTYSFDIVAELKDTDGDIYQRRLIRGKKLYRFSGDRVYTIANGKMVNLLTLAYEVK